MFSNNVQETIILSVGGSLIVTNDGIDSAFLKKFNLFIRKHVKKGRKFFIVVGGGKTSRKYRDAGASVIDQVTDEDLDWLGIHSARLNAHLVRTIFHDIAHPRIIENYQRKLINAKEPVIIASGWKPGWSTDYDAVVLARDYKASVIVNLSNIDYVYDKDPVKFKDARPIKKITWDDFEKIVGDKWKPGIHAPFDPIASQLAKQLRLTVIVANGHKFRNIDNILNGEPYIGTVISPIKVDANFYDREYYEGAKGEYRFSYTESIFGHGLQKMVNWYRAIYLYWAFKPRNALDVGCGNGLLIKYLRRMGVEAYGIEISSFALDKADKEVRPYLNLGSVTQIPYENDTFDLIITYDVMEHLERSKLKKAMEETIRVSRKWIFHKIYTRENYWIHLFHTKDYSHLSVLSIKYWQNLIKYIENVMTVKRPFFRIPSFFETSFVLRKKTSI